MQVFWLIIICSLDKIISILVLNKTSVLCKLKRLILILLILLGLKDFKRANKKKHKWK